MAALRIAEEMREPDLQAPLRKGHGAYWYGLFDAERPLFRPSQPGAEQYPAGGVRRCSRYLINPKLQFGAAACVESESIPFTISR